MKPEQEEIAQLKREVAKLKAERDILKNGGCGTTCWPEAHDVDCTGSSD